MEIWKRQNMMTCTLPSAPGTRAWDEARLRLLIWGGSKCDADHAPAFAPASGASTELPAGETRRLCVLVIEDNRDYAESLQSFFELFGHTVVVAYTGLEGLQAALAGGFDAIVCDLGLPGISGFEVARRVRQEPRMKNVYIIAVTGYGTDRDLEESAASGFDAHLVKPVEAADILKKLEDGAGGRPEN